MLILTTWNPHILKQVQKRTMYFIYFYWLDLNVAITILLSIIYYFNFFYYIIVILLYI